MIAVGKVVLIAHLYTLLSPTSWDRFRECVDTAAEKRGSERGIKYAPLCSGVKMESDGGAHIGALSVTARPHTRSA